jgi:hypothetical protein
MHPAMPAGDNDDVIRKPLAVRHVQDHRAGACLAIATPGALPGGREGGPAVMGCPCELPARAKLVQKPLDPGPVAHRAGRGGMARAAVAQQDLFRNDHPSRLPHPCTWRSHEKGRRPTRFPEPGAAVTRGTRE